MFNKHHSVLFRPLTPLYYLAWCLLNNLWANVMKQPTLEALLIALSCASSSPLLHPLACDLKINLGAPSWRILKMHLEERGGSREQLRAGMHRCTLCRSFFGTREIEEAWCIAGIYKPLAGAGLHRCFSFISCISYFKWSNEQLNFLPYRLV